MTPAPGERTQPDDSGATAGAGARASKLGFLWISVAVLVLDQWTKWLVEQKLARHAVRVAIPGFLNWTHIRNTGLAFGLFASAGDQALTMVLLILGLLALAVVGFYFWKAEAAQRALLSALSLVLGGAVGNLIDRLANGAVTDFVDVHLGVHHWPAFNVADSAITIGILLLAADVLLPLRGAAD